MTHLYGELKRNTNPQSFSRFNSADYKCDEDGIGSQVEEGPGCYRTAQTLC